ncbi:MAG: serine/threonine protein kinase [Acidobacteria bacterium]|nr:serine/threonine protein kinase [Acidobacteriota bacterium]
MDPVKLVAYRNAFDHLSVDEQHACLARLRRGQTYEQIALDLGAASAAQARGTVTRAMDRLLRDVFGGTAPRSERLADLLGEDAPPPGDLRAGRAPADMSPEEEALLRELLVLAKTEPPLDTWGKFTDLKEIGSGGFGTVYSAMDPVLQTRVALKLYHPHRSQRPTEELLGEARKLARVRHPNVVVVHGADEIDGRVGVWMELVEGDTLDVEVRVGPRLDAEAAAEVGIAICQALEAVHAAGVVHGDIKAQNVVRGTDGRIVLMDFGAARFRDPSAVEAPETRAGTPAYMAPELFRLRGDRLVEPTVQSDVYAVGVLLFYLVTGKHPVSGRSADEIRDAHEHGEQMLLLSDERPDLPEDFAQVVEQALARTPEQRWISVAEMGQGLVASKPRSDPAFSQTRIWRVARAAATIIPAIAFLGLLKIKAFEEVLSIPSDFTLSPTSYFMEGAASLTPYFAMWGFAAFGFGLLLGLLHGLRRVFSSRMEPVWARWAQRMNSVHAKTTAAAILLVGVTALAGMIWAFYDPLLTPLLALFTRASGSSAPPAMFDPALRGILQQWGVCAAALSFVLGLATWRWFPYLERRVGDASTVRLMRWATIGVAFLAVAITFIPRRLLWESFEIAEFQARQMYVVGSTDSELLLYDPRGTDHPFERVSTADPEVRRTGLNWPLFEVPPEQR